MLSFFRRKKVAAATKMERVSSGLNQPVKDMAVEVDPKLGLNVQYGISIICKQKGEANLIINGTESQLTEMIASGLKNNKRFRDLVRAGFRKSNLPIK